MSQDRRKTGDRRQKQSATAIARENQTAAENLVRQSGNRLNIRDARSRIERVRKERDDRIAKKRNK